MFLEFVNLRPMKVIMRYGHCSSWGRCITEVLSKWVPGETSTMLFR